MTRAVLLVAAGALLAGCGPAPTTVQMPHADPTTEGWYAQDTQRLAKMDRAAAQLVAAGRNDEAAAVVQSALSIQTRLLAAPRPTLEAMEAIGDLDHIYGRMLISNGYFGEARMLFQKNVTRWRTWKTPTPETEQRLKEANGDIAECDRHMGG